MILEEKRDAYCGLYCGACPVFISTTAAIAAGKTDFTNPEGFCLGCKSAVVSGWCAQCTLKSCAKEKGFDTCAECAEYPCEPMKGFIEAAELGVNAGPHGSAEQNIALHKAVLERFAKEKAGAGPVSTASAKPAGGRTTV